MLVERGRWANGWGQVDAQGAGSTATEVGEMRIAGGAEGNKTARCHTSTQKMHSSCCRLRLLESPSLPISFVGTALKVALSSGDLFCFCFYQHEQKEDG